MPTSFWYTCHGIRSLAKGLLSLREARIMDIEKQLHQRSDSSCELCGRKEKLTVYEVPPGPRDAAHSVLTCSGCYDQLGDPGRIDLNHWRCLNMSIWSDIPAVKVVSWRVLRLLKAEGWAQDLLDMLYLDDETLAWAESSPLESDDHSQEQVVHKDSNGNILHSGDTVVLIKDLDVKGAGFTAKRGTPVRGISLVENNAGQIEGKVNGQQIVILTQFVRKSG
jgi:protein PhnA